MRLRGWIWALALAGMTAFSVWQLKQSGAVQTDLLDMLPATERNPVAEEAIRAMAKTTGERAVFLVRAGEPSASKAAALKLAELLRGSGAFQDVTAALPPIDPGVLVRFYAPHRWRLAPPPEGFEASPEALRARLESSLSSPGGSFSALGIGADPLGTLDGFLARLPASRLAIEDDLLVVHAPEGLYVMVTAGLKGSPFDPVVQDRMLRAVGEAEGSLKAAWSGL